MFTSATLGGEFGLCASRCWTRAVTCRVATVAFLWRVPAVSRSLLALIASRVEIKRTSPAATYGCGDGDPECVRQRPIHAATASAPRQRSHAESNDAGSAAR